MRLGAIAVASALALAAGCGTPESNTGGDISGPGCQIEAEGEKSPGYPYDLETYSTVIAPQIVKDCSGAACHGKENPANGGLSIFPDTKPGECNFAKTFESMKAKINLTTPGDSRLLAAISLRDDHPKYPDSFAVLKPYIEAAAEEAGQVDNPNADPYDIVEFAETIQPIIVDGGCAISGCHLSPAASGGFTMLPDANAGDALTANFTAVKNRMDINEPADSIFLAYSENSHAGVALDADDLAVILAWGEDAKTNAGGGGGGTPPPACIDPDNFNLGVFQDEIEPILFGEALVDNTSCATSACHGAVRGGGAFVLVEGDSAANLASFACFIDLAQPIRSEILDCPTNGGVSCRRKPHPGEDPFEDGAADQNYQRILGYLYATKTSTVPIDFAFFARVINPLFSDPNSVQDGASGDTCADSDCHGVQVPGQQAPNGSNFPMIGERSDEDTLAFNYSSALNFVNFIQPEGSSLFLYPTNEIANLDNPFGTGLAHPGGEDFAVDDPEALLILQWANGLRLDNDGFVNFWLVGGDYTGTDIRSTTALGDEEDINPAIFDDMRNNQFNRGEWDLLLADNNVVDLNEAFPRAVNPGRAAFASMYVINLSSQEIEGRFEIVSNDQVRVYVNDQLAEEANDASGGQSGIVNFPGSGLGTGGSTRILVKLFQPVGEDDFSFTFRLTDEDGDPLQPEDVVIVLDSKGGF